MKNKKLKLKDYIPEGYRFHKLDMVNSWDVKNIKNAKVVDVLFVVKKIKSKESTKEQLLEKAKRDYFDGVVVDQKVAYNGNGSVITLRGNDAKWTSDHNIDVSGTGVYSTRHGKWAKIISKPVIKVDNKHLYEGDEYWSLDKKTYKLIYHKITAGYVSGSGAFEYFLTKQAALDYVMVEAKERFKGCKKAYRTKHSDYCTPVNLKISSEWPSCGDYVEYKEEIGGSISGKDNTCVWTYQNGFIAEPIKQDVLEWIRVMKKDVDNEHVWWNNHINDIVGVIEFNSGHNDLRPYYRVKYGVFTDYHIQLEFCQSATKAEIEAHKLGFHIGDKVYHTNVSGHDYKIASFSISKLDKVCIESANGCHISLSNLTKENPNKLMLGNCKVEIERVFEANTDYLIKANGGQVTKEEWLSWEKVFTELLKINMLDSFVLDFGIDYEMVYYRESGMCDLGCIKDVTIEQIQQVTKRLNEM